MTSFRLSKELEDKLEIISKEKNNTKSDIIREAVERYITDYEKSNSPFDLGKELFGRYGSSDGSLAKQYKKKVKEKIHEKMSR